MTLHLASQWGFRMTKSVVTQNLTAFWKKIETWHTGLSCQYAHFMSISRNLYKHDTIADLATHVGINLHHFL